MRLIFDHLNVHICTNKKYEERAVFLDTSCAGFRSRIACIGYFRHFNLTFFLFLKIDVIEFAKMVQENKFIVN